MMSERISAPVLCYQLQAPASGIELLKARQSSRFAPAARPLARGSPLRLPASRSPAPLRVSASSEPAAEQEGQAVTSAKNNKLGWVVSLRSNATRLPSAVWSIVLAAGADNVKGETAQAAELLGTVAEDDGPSSLMDFASDAVENVMEGAKNAMEDAMESAMEGAKNAAAEGARSAAEATRNAAEATIAKVSSASPAILERLRSVGSKKAPSPPEPQEYKPLEALARIQGNLETSVKTAVEQSTKTAADVEAASKVALQTVQELSEKSKVTLAETSKVLTESAQVAQSTVGAVKETVVNIKTVVDTEGVPGVAKVALPTVKSVFEQGTAAVGSAAALAVKKGAEVVDEITDWLTLQAPPEVKPLVKAIDETWDVVQYDPETLFITSGLLAGGVGAVWLSVWLWLYGGYAGDLSPKGAIALMESDKGVFMVFVDATGSGAPALDAEVMNQVLVVPVNKLNATERAKLEDPDLVEVLSLAPLISRLRQLRKGGSVVLIGDNMTNKHMKQLARSASFLKRGLKVYRVAGMVPRSWKMHPDNTSSPV
eukprot:jgi/Mesvir1/278/Mv13613-RA.1